jgi:hypothetical protein
MIYGVKSGQHLRSLEIVAMRTSTHTWKYNVHHQPQIADNFTLVWTIERHDNLSLDGLRKI